MTFREKLKDNSCKNAKGVYNDLVELVQNGKIVVCVSVCKNEKHDTVVDSGDSIVYFQKVANIDETIKEDQKVFIVTGTAWNNMCNANMWVHREDV